MMMLILPKYWLVQSLFADIAIIIITRIVGVVYGLWFYLNSAPYGATMFWQLLRLANVVAFEVSCELLILLDHGNTRLTL